MKSGIKQKMLLALGAVLVFTIGLIVLLASYYTGQQNEDAAFAEIDNDLLAWRSDLNAATAQLRRAALALAGDRGVLDQLAWVLTAEQQANASGSIGKPTGIERTLAYTKTVSLNRLDFMLQMGAFSSIAVYTGQQLSHYVSSSEAGMLVLREHAGPLWLRAPTGADGTLPLQSWHSWQKSSPPSDLSRSMPDVKQPKILTSFPAADSTAIDVVVPIEGIVREFPKWWPGEDREQFVSDLAIAGTTPIGTSGVGSGRPVQVALLIFRKHLNRALLQDVAAKTRKWPALFSSDGQHRQELTDFRLIPAELLPKPGPSASNTASQLTHNTVSTHHGSFYVGALTWRFDGQPGLVLAFALSRDKTLANMRETVVAILIVAGTILLLSMAIGALWVDHFTRPILALTAAANRIIGPNGASGPDMHALQRVEQLELPPAQDEIGALARAFNLMMEELRRSFETLEQRVQTRTAELRQQARYLRTLLDTLPLWVCLKDTQGRYLAVNEAMARFSGLSSAEEMTGKLDVEVFQPERAAIVQAEDAQVMHLKRRLTVEERIPLASQDEPAWVERFRVPVLDDDGTALGVVHVCRDISAQKIAERARESALEEAVRLARLRSDFLARMSHELRTPLNAILGYAQILQRDGQLSSRQIRGLATIQSSGEHLLNLINDILDLARIDAGRLDLAPADISPAPFLESIADAIRVKARQKSLVFRYEADDLPEAVRVDGKRLRQVLLNLLSNAVKFTDTGEVLLKVQRLAPPLNDGETNIVRLRFEIQDSGIGMSAEQVRRIFQPFEQVADLDRREGGSGLGLAISQQLVHLMGGEIRVETAHGHGSRFSFELEMPLATGTPTAVAPEFLAISYEGCRRSILVVDDAPVNAAVLIDMLAPLGFEVRHAGDAEEALAELKRKRPDLVIMDIIMPRTDGLAATQQIRGTPELADIPIVAVSANAAPEEAARSYAAGVNAFLPKPVQYDALLRTIGELLGLTWTLTERAPEDGEAERHLIVPSAEEIDLLFGLALEGNMRSIRLRADYLSNLDARYRPFAAQLRRLAESYQSKAILSLIDKYRQHPVTDAS